MNTDTFFNLPVLFFIKSNLAWLGCKIKIDIYFVEES